MSYADIKAELIEFNRNVWAGIGWEMQEGLSPAGVRENNWNDYCNAASGPSDKHQAILERLVAAADAEGVDWPKDKSWDLYGWCEPARHVSYDAEIDRGERQAADRPIFRDASGKLRPWYRPFAE